MLEGVDLDQPAGVLWWADEQIPTKGFKWGGSNHQFGTLWAALNFALTQLSESELGTAVVNFNSPPGSIDFNDPEVRERAKEWYAKAAKAV